MLLSHFEPALGEEISPLPGSEVLVTTRHAEDAVSGPVHEGDETVSERPAQVMILHDHQAPGHPPRIAQQARRLIRMVQNVGQQDDVHGTIRQGDRPPVVCFDLDRRAGARLNLQPTDLHALRTARIGQNRLRERPRPAPDIQHPVARPKVRDDQRCQ